jgi:hypothetical protein
MRTPSHRAASLGFVMLLVGALAVPDVRAEILLAQSTISASVYGGATYNVDFNGAAAGGTTFSFETTEPNTRVMFIFNAECAVDGARTRAVGINIMVDPAGAAAEAAISPSNGDNALCSGDGTTTATPDDFTLDGWVSASTVATKLFTVAGTHTVRVVVDGTNSLLARLDDMSLTVIR